VQKYILDSRPINLRFVIARNAPNWLQSHENALMLTVLVSSTVTLPELTSFASSENFPMTVGRGTRTLVGNATSPKFTYTFLVRQIWSKLHQKQPRQTQDVYDRPNEYR